MCSSCSPTRADLDGFFLVNGTPATDIPFNHFKNIDLKKKRADKWTICGRCNGTGIYSHYHGICFACNGNKGKFKGVKLYTQEELKKKEKKAEEKKQAKELAWDQSVRNSLKEINQTVEGFSLAYMKAKIISSSGHKLPYNSPAQINDIKNLSDIVNKNNHWSVPKAEFLMALVERIGEREKRIKEDDRIAKEALNDRSKWITEGRRDIDGTIISIKEKFNNYNGGIDLKCLVKCDNGQKFYGTLPKERNDADLKVGDKIHFMGTVTPSTDDKLFGFYKRPSKADIIIS